MAGGEKKHFLAFYGVEKMKWQGARGRRRMGAAQKRASSLLGNVASHCGKKRTLPLFQDASMKNRRFLSYAVVCLVYFLLFVVSPTWGFVIEEHLWESQNPLTPIGVPGMTTNTGSSSSYYVKDDTWRTTMSYHVLKLEAGQTAEIEIGALVPNPAGTGLKIWVTSLESLGLGTLSQVTPLPTYVNNIAKFSTEMSSGKKTLTITSSSSGSFTIAGVTFTSSSKNICIVVAASTVGAFKTGLCAYSITTSVTKFSGGGGGGSDGTVEVTFVSAGDTIWKSRYTVGDTYKMLLAPTKIGYTFDGWYSTSSFAASSRVTWTNTVSAYVKTLYAKWTPNRYFIKYNYDGGTAGENNPTLADFDTPFRVSAPTRSGWTFAGWKVTAQLNTSTAMWGTTAEATTPISSSSDQCVNGATGDVYFLNLTSDRWVTNTLKAVWTSGAAAPGAPTGLSATTTLTNGIQISWTGGLGATLYNVWRGTTTTRGDARRIKNGATSPYPDNDSELVAGKSYYYWIEATNSAGSTFSTSYAKGRKAVTLSLGRSVVSATADGGNQSFSVTANTSWSASSGASWISFTTGSGSGSGTCAFTVEANPDANARTGTVTVVAGKNTDAPKSATVSVVQQAKARFAVGSYELDMGDGLVWLRFPGAKGTTYRVERAKELGGTWATAMTFTATNDGMNEVSASIPGKWNTGFFRLGKDGGGETESPGTSTNAPTGLYLVVDLSGGPDAASWPVSELDAVPSGGWTDEYKTTKLVLRKIEAGTFTMGSPSGESGRWADESQHQVTLTKPYYIGVFEVTQKQYALVMGSNPSYFSGDKQPVETVSWNTIRGNTNWPASSAVSADSFMGRLRARTGLAFDLPTEAQWEHACRAGTTTAYSYGDSANGDYMWYWYNSSQPTHEVGGKKPNAWGLYDMHGNVWEWCLDWYASNLGTAAVTDPKGASSGSHRVRRGGGWVLIAADCRSAHRSNYTPSDSGSFLGFRLSRILSD